MNMCCTKSILVAAALLLMVEVSYCQKISRKEYIDTYAELAMQEMIRSGIPASIKLAQGILETNNGNSRLAVKGNNHFGIKCHTGWKGRKMYHDDDAENECFRRYKNPYDSYIDHSEFLTGRQRYAALFELEITDYKGWAKGLKAAGYATARKYADLLIKIIEENELQQYDYLALNELDPEDFKDRQLASKRKYAKRKAPKSSMAKRDVQMRNRVDYVMVKPGDSFSSLNEEFNLIGSQLRRYNDLSADFTLQTGQILYLQPKRNKAEAGKRVHIVKDGESMHDISQLYAVKLLKLYQRNLISPGEEPEPGTEILLRKRKKGALLTMAIEAPEEEEEGELRFEFQE